MPAKPDEKQHGDLPRNIGNPATDALHHIGYFTLEKVATLTLDEIKNIHGIGPKAIGFLQVALKEKGLTFAGEDPDTDLPVKLAAPARRALLGAGYKNVEQIAQANITDIQELHGIGKNALDVLRAALAAKGLTFADEKGT